MNPPNKKQFQAAPPRRGTEIKKKQPDEPSDPDAALFNQFYLDLLHDHQGTQASTQQTNIESQSNFNTVFNDLGLNSHLESYTVKHELIRLANIKYSASEFKKLEDKVSDLETTVDINKSLIQNLLSTDSNKEIQE